ncbi:hypothetical protein TNCV_3542691 [Trichonephila clavipes]|nr:hypothetical protein TNCV_3542691 [Trichonephila clavipes]
MRVDQRGTIKQHEGFLRRISSVRISIDEDELPPHSPSYHTTPTGGLRASTDLTAPAPESVRGRCACVALNDFPLSVDERNSYGIPPAQNNVNCCSTDLTKDN